MQLPFISGAKWSSHKQGDQSIPVPSFHCYKFGSSDVRVKRITPNAKNIILNAVLAI